MAVLLRRVHYLREDEFRHSHEFTGEIWICLDRRLVDIASEQIIEDYRRLNPSFFATAWAFAMRASR
jgi:hypothetical protein